MICNFAITGLFQYKFQSVLDQPATTPTITQTPDGQIIGLPVLTTYVNQFNT